MDRNTVSSSAIKSIGYDAAKSQLEVEFSSGSVYRYHDVKPENYAELFKAQSVGKHFGKHIAGKFKSEKIEEKATGVGK